jgi:NAD(P)-dependent dehydrogenase (short-subunit alcohol dehydrogenase family)
VICGCRTIEPESSNANPTNISQIQLDITDSNSVNNAVQTITQDYGKLDVLINNAGVSTVDAGPMDGLVKCLTTNVVGSARVTESFLPLLKKSSSPRLLFVTSSLGSITDRSDPSSVYTPVKDPGYRTSKAALNMLMACYWHELAEEGFKVFTLCPGPLLTDIVGNKEYMRQLGGAEPEVGGRFILSVMNGERDADVGKFLKTDGIWGW